MGTPHVQRLALMHERISQFLYSCLFQLPATEGELYGTEVLFFEYFFFFSPENSECFAIAAFWQRFTSRHPSSGHFYVVVTVFLVRGQSEDGTEGHPVIPQFCSCTQIDIIEQVKVQFFSQRVQATRLCDIRVGPFNVFVARFLQKAYGNPLVWVPVIVQTQRDGPHLQACYFDRDDVGLPKISKWLKKQSEEERGHAIGFMKYQNTRGGRIVLQNIQVRSIEEISKFVTNLKRVGRGLGEYIFDREHFDDN
uniref:Ferritin/DPS protein domain-containing protein n=1 Tax=Parascaris equorum TaxID=6256 RepID=A0A914RWS1_PAREQ